MLKNLLTSLLFIFLMSGCLPAIIGTTMVTGVITGTQDRTVKEIRGDVEIWTSIKNQFLQYNTRDLFQNISLKVTEGRVLLTGNVKQMNTKFLAERIAWVPDGVVEVINQIELKDSYKIRDIARDSMITTKVKARLALERDVRSNNYKIQTVNSVVYVIGVTKSKIELSKAIDIISKVYGVKRVVNYVVIRKNEIIE